MCIKFIMRTSPRNTRNKICLVHGILHGCNMEYAHEHYVRNAKLSTRRVQKLYISISATHYFTNTTKHCCTSHTSTVPGEVLSVLIDHTGDNFLDRLVVAQTHKLRCKFRPQNIERDLYHHPTAPHALPIHSLMTEVSLRPRLLGSPRDAKRRLTTNVTLRLPVSQPLWLSG